MHATALVLQRHKSLTHKTGWNICLNHNERKLGVLLLNQKSFSTPPFSFQPQKHIRPKTQGCVNFPLLPHMPLQCHIKEKETHTEKKKHHTTHTHTHHFISAHTMTQIPQVLTLIVYHWKVTLHWKRRHCKIIPKQRSFQTNAYTLNLLRAHNSLRKFKWNGFVYFSFPRRENFHNVGFIQLILTI